MRMQEGQVRSVSAAALFQRVWDELVGLIGTPATAALMRRGLKHASARAPAIPLPAVKRDGLDYAYVTPEPWSDPARRDAVDELARLLREDLDPLFRELTGPVVSRRLARVRELVEAGIAAREEP